MSSNGYREMISSYLWLSFHYTSYKPKSGIVFQVHWNHSWLESTFFFDLLAELPYVACDGLAKLRPPVLRLSDMFTVLRDLVSRIFSGCLSWLCTEPNRSQWQPTSIRFPSTQVRKGHRARMKNKNKLESQVSSQFSFHPLVQPALDLCPFFSLFADVQVVDTYSYQELKRKTDMSYT